jgi:hypothetical protein
MAVADDHDDETYEDEVPEGAAVFPPIPAELGVSPALLAILHAIVFIAGSDEAIVHPAAGDEALQGMAGYLDRLDGATRERFLGDLKALREHAREHGWPKQLTAFLKDFPRDFLSGE